MFKGHNCKTATWIHSWDASFI